MEIIALGILVAISTAFLVYQLGLVRSRLVALEQRNSAVPDADPKALAAAQEAIAASHEAQDASQKATEISQRALDTATANAARLRAIPAVLPAPDFGPPLTALRLAVDEQIIGLKQDDESIQNQVTASSEAIRKLNARIDNLSVAKGKIPDDMGL